jgi:hypothetical protein
VEPQTLYEVIGVAPDADEDTIRKAVGAQSSQWSKRVSMAATIEKRHEAERMMQVIQEARRALLDRAARSAYDQGLVEVSAQAIEESAAFAAAHAEEAAARMPCPYCLELILVGAKKCRWCNEWLEAKATGQEPDGAAKRTPTGPLNPDVEPKRPHSTDVTLHFTEDREHAGGTRGTQASQALQPSQALTVQATAALTTQSKSALTSPSTKHVLTAAAYGSGWARGCAVVIDTTLYFLGIGIAEAMNPTFGALMVLSHPLWYIFYEGSSARGTPGQQTMKLMVVTEEQRQMSLGQALVRYFSRYFSLVCLCLGYLSIFVDPKKQAWHDKIAGTIVMKR